MRLGLAGGASLALADVPGYSATLLVFTRSVAAPMIFANGFE